MQEKKHARGRANIQTVSEPKSSCCLLRDDKLETASPPPETAVPVLSLSSSAQKSLRTIGGRANLEPQQAQTSNVDAN